MPGMDSVAGRGVSRVLGVDYGDRRTGVAVSDESGVIAFPRETLVCAQVAQAAAAVARVAAAEGVGCIVVGYPINMDGTAGARGATDAFIAELGQRTEIRVVRWDERLSTRSGGGFNRGGASRARRKGVVDKLAAQRFYKLSGCAGGSRGWGSDDGGAVVKQTPRTRPPKGRRYRMTIAYDGTDFYGWQTQPAKPTVQGALEGALRQLTGEAVRVHSSGRTDTGVHARGQTAHFDLRKPWEAGALQKGLNAVLPEAVRVSALRRAADTFHARYDATGKEYRYSIWNARVGCPLERRQAVHIRAPLDVAAMRGGGDAGGHARFRGVCGESAPRDGWHGAHVVRLEVASGGAGDDSRGGGRVSLQDGAQSGGSFAARGERGGAGGGNPRAAGEPAADGPRGDGGGARVVSAPCFLRGNSGTSQTGATVLGCSTL